MAACPASSSLTTWPSPGRWGWPPWRGSSSCWGWACSSASSSWWWSTCSTATRCPSSATSPRAPSGRAGTSCFLVRLVLSLCLTTLAAGLARLGLALRYALIHHNMSQHPLEVGGAVPGRAMTCEFPTRPPLTTSSGSNGRFLSVTPAMDCDGDGLPSVPALVFLKAVIAKCAPARS